jgi:hypothetical protein
LTDVSEVLTVSVIRALNKPLPKKFGIYRRKYDKGEARPVY